MASSKSKSNGNKPLMIVGFLVVVVVAFVLAYSFSTGNSVVPGFTGAGNDETLSSALCPTPIKSLTLSSTTDLTKYLTLGTTNQSEKMKRSGSKFVGTVDFDLVSPSFVDTTTRSAFAVFKNSAPSKLRLVQNNVLVDLSDSDIISENSANTYTTRITHSFFNSRNDRLNYRFTTKENEEGNIVTDLEIAPMKAGVEQVKYTKKLTLDETKLEHPSIAGIAVRQLVVERNERNVQIYVVYLDGTKSTALTATLPENYSLSGYSYVNSGFSNNSGDNVTGQSKFYTSGINVYSCDGKVPSGLAPVVSNNNLN